MEKKIDQKLLDLAVKTLKNGKIISLATDTIYGIACDAKNDHTIQRIYQIKNRDHKKSVAIFAPNIDFIEKNFYLNDLEKKIIYTYLPGSLTIILKKKSNQFSKFLNQNDDTLGVRIPNNQFCLDLLQKYNDFIAVSSANISNQASAINILEIKNNFNNKIDLIIDNGVCNDQIASTIVQIVDNEIKILRHGKILDFEALF